MTEALEESSIQNGRWIQIVAAIVALAGLADAVYLTIHDLTATPVPCDIVAGCETVLTSIYAKLWGVPIAAFGALSYFTAFSLAILAAYGNRTAWMLFGLQAFVMVLVTCWLLYLQAFVIGAFCQFCLFSALTSFLLFIIFIIYKAMRRPL